VSVCVYNTRFVNPISINVVLVLYTSWDNLQRIYVYNTDRPIIYIYVFELCDGESRGETNS